MALLESKWCLLLMLSVSYVLGLDPQYCQHSKENCNGESCATSVACYHGDCSESGQCECDLCWQGESCDEYVDRYQPMFLKSSETVVLSDPWSVEPFFTVHAYDRDLGTTCPVDALVCECAETRYSFVSGNQQGLFHINNITGDLFVREAGQISLGQTYSLVVAAYAGEWAPKSWKPVIMELKVKVDNLYHHLANELQGDILSLSGEEELVRSKRSAANENYMTEFNFTLLSGETESMEVGRRLDYSLEIHIPKTDGMDLTVELFTKDIGNGNYTPVLAVFNVEVESAGLTLSRKDGPHIEMLLNEEINTAYDRAIVSFGEVKNKNDGPVPITMFFSVTQIKNPNTVYDTKYLVTAGAEYDKETYIWVGQSEVLVHNSSDDRRIEADIIGPKEIPLDSAGVYILMAHIAVRSDNFTVEISGLDNTDIVTVGNLGVQDFDDNFDPVPQSIYFYNTTMEGSEDDAKFTAAKLNLGVMTNVGQYEKPRDPGNVINSTFAIYALNNETNIGKTVEFTASIWVGREQLYSESYTVRIVPRKDADKMVTARYTKGELTTPTASIGDMAMYTIWSNLTNGGYADFVMEVSVPRDNKELPRLEACSARLWNYKDSFDVPYINTTFVDPDVADGKFIFRFNRIHVTGQRNPSIYNDSMIYIHLIVKISTLKTNKEDDRLTPTISVGTQGSASEKVPVTGVVIRKDADPVSPTVSVDNAADWPYMYVGGAVVLNISVFVPSFQGYSEVLLEASGESDPPLPAVHVCRAELSEVGQNLPCLRMHREEVNADFTKYALSNPKTRKKPDIASVMLGDVGALPVEGMNFATMTLIVELPEGSIIKEDESFPISSGLYIENKNIWALVANYTMKKGPPPPLEESKMPEATAVYNSTEGIMPGHLAEVLITLRTQAQSISNYSIEIEAVTKDVSMCGLKVKSFGRNMPCIDNETEPFYEPHDNPLDGNKVAGLKFSALTNVGFQSKAEDDSLISVALVRISPSCKSKKVDLEWRVVFGGGIRSGQIEIPVNLDSDNSDTSMMVQEPKALAFKPAYKNKAIAMGTPVVVDLEVSLEPGSLAPVMVQMKNAQKKVPYDMCLGGIWFRGKNYPCFSPVQVESNFSASDSESGKNDSAVYNLGLVCNTFVDNREEENKVVVRMAMRPLDDGSLKLREQFSVEGYATVGSHSRKIDTLKFSIAMEADQVEVQKNASLKLVNPDPIEIRIHQRLWIPFNVTIPPDSLLKVEVEARAPVKDKRAVMTVHNIRLVSGGANIPCPMLYPQPKIEFAPIVETTQKDVIKGYVGVFTNLGLTHKMNMALEGDDDLTIEVEVEMSDHPDTKHLSEFMLNFTAEVGRSKLLVQQPMRVWRDGSERADLAITVDVDNKKTYQSGDSLNVTITAVHTQESTAEPVNATIRLYLPPYVEFNKVVFNNATVVGTVHFLTEAGGLDIVLPQFLFSDSATIIVDLLADPKYQRGFGRGEVNATTPYRVLCTQTFREEPSLNPPSADTIVSCGPIDYIMYVVNSQECYKSLGLGSPKKIYKCQLSASSAAKKETGPYNIRMGSRRGWSPALRLGPHKPYYQVDFLRTTRVAKLEFAKVEGSRAVTKYSLQYSHTGSDWLTANEVTELEYNKKGRAMDDLAKPIQTRFVRVIVEEAEKGNEDTEYIGLKMEMYGCYVSEKSQSVSCAKDDPTWYSDDKNKYGRHFSIDTARDIAYFCDLEYDMETLVCFSSRDAGSSWNVLPRSFGGILGYDRKLSRTYAIDKKNRAYMASDDGLQWVAVEEREANDTMSKKSFLRSEPVPAFTSEDIELLETKTGRWEASFNGLMYEGKPEPRARWSRCCKIAR